MTASECHLQQACKEEKSICYASRSSIIVSVSGRARATWRIQDGRWRVHPSSIVQTKWLTHISWAGRAQTLKSSSHLYLLKIRKSIIVQTRDRLYEQFYCRLFVFVCLFSQHHQASEQNWADIDSRWLFSCSAVFVSCWLPASAPEENKSPLCRSTTVRGGGCSERQENICMNEC